MRTLILVLLAVAPVAADTVVLRSGGTFEGIVTEAGDRVTVKMDVGTVTFRKIDVVRITLSRSPLIVFQERLNGLADADVAGRLDLAAWAAENDLDQNAKAVYESVIRRETNNETARAALGYRRHDGSWYRGDDYQRAIGNVYYKGGWITREEYQAILDREAELKKPVPEPVPTPPVIIQLPPVQVLPPVVYVPVYRRCCPRPSSHEPGCCDYRMAPMMPVLPVLPPAPVEMCRHNPCASTCWMWIRDHIKK